MDISKRKLLLRSFSLYNSKEKKQLSIVLMLSIINSLIQTIGIASIMPFIAIISDPSLANSNHFFIFIKDLMGIETHRELLLVLGGLTFTSLVAGNLFTIIDYWATLKFFNTKGHKLSKKLLGIYLDKTPLKFLKVSSAELYKSIYSDVDRVLIGSQMAVIELISDIMILCVVFSLLMYIDVWVTLITTFTFSTGYFLIYVLLSNKISLLGEQFSIYETQVFAYLKQALALFREIKISAKKDYFVEQYSKPSKTLSDNSTRYGVLSFIPVQLIEVVAFGVIITMSIYLALFSTNMVNTITSVSVFAFAAYRLLPILKSIFDGFEDILYSSKVLKKLLTEYDELNKDPSQINTTEKLKLTENIILDNISYQYDENLPMLLNNLNAQISVNQFTCITGRSGVGKSTTLDMLLGLIKPSKGQLLINNKPLDETNTRSWQNSIGYVPQKIQLLDGSVEQNIAFGINKNNIDKERVKTVASMAAISSSIENNLIDKYDTIIGDGGINLSGGEMQRIGIARCLYHDPQIFIFDEATNELDAQTETQILRKISELPDKTIIFVSHKMSVVDIADHIIKIESNRL